MPASSPLKNPAPTKQVKKLKINYIQKMYTLCIYIKKAGRCFVDHFMLWV
jgi:hypothetical protein